MFRDGAADEMWLSSSTNEVLAVTTVDGEPFAGGKPGPVFRGMWALFQTRKPKARIAAQCSCGIRPPQTRIQTGNDRTRRAHGYSRRASLDCLVTPAEGDRVTKPRYWSVQRARVNEAFTGVTWAAIVLIVVVCVFDAFRDSLVGIVEGTPSQWGRYFWRRLYPTLLMALVMVLAVMWTRNRHPEPGWRQAGAVALAVLVPGALGVLMKLHLLRILYMRPQVFDDWYYESAGAYFVWYFVRYATLGLLFATL